MTLPRTGQRKVGNPPVVSLGLTAGASTTATGAAGVSTLPVACTIRALCGAPAAILTGGAAGAAATAGAAAAAAVVLAPGTVSFMPRLSLAEVSRLLAFASSATGT